MRGTTLSTAWTWSAWACGVWLLASLAEAFVPLVDRRGMLDRLWFLAALMFTCTSIAVLGARRPGVRVWNWFVLVPLLVVLGWPALTVGSLAAMSRPLELDRPAVLAVGLVLLMGTGNFLRTRFALPAVLAAAAVAAVVTSLAAPSTGWPVTPPQGRSGGTLVLAAALHLARRYARRVPPSPDPLDRLWLDFRDWFGIAWALRIMERVNQAAAAEGWPARLTFDGFAWHNLPADAAARQLVRERIEHTLRWLLRRFVDAEWIDVRLAAG